MTFYNMGQKYEKSIGVNNVDLCLELMSEESFADNITEEYFRDKIHNHDKSGIVDKLEKKLGYRINEFMEDGNVINKFSR